MVKQLAADINADVLALVDAMNSANQTLQYTPYKGYEITETRRKFHLLNSILSNEQRSGVMLIDRETGYVYKSAGYGKRGAFAGNLESVTQFYKQLAATNRPGVEV